MLISAPEVLNALKERAASDLNGELLAFSDADALIALEAITKRRPKIVVLEKSFAGTPRGMALINRIKADPALGDAEMRVMSHDSDAVRVVNRTAASAAPAAESGGPSAAAAATATLPTPALDQRGTRRAARYKIGGSLDVLVDGNVATLIDLSTMGAQVVSGTILKPNQRVRMALSDDVSNVRFNAAVAWASFEIPPKSGPRYRAGLEFVDADSGSVNAFCQRHKQH